MLSQLQFVQGLSVSVAMFAVYTFIALILLTAWDFFSGDKLLFYLLRVPGIAASAAQIILVRKSYVRTHLRRLLLAMNVLILIPSFLLALNTAVNDF